MLVTAIVDKILHSWVVSDYANTSRSSGAATRAQMTLACAVIDVNNLLVNYWIYYCGFIIIHFYVGRIVHFYFYSSESIFVEI